MYYFGAWLWLVELLIAHDELDKNVHGQFQSEPAVPYFTWTDGNHRKLVRVTGIPAEIRIGYRSTTN
jgi:hypothetical protein